MRALRLLDGPIITAETHPSIGENIQGPSLVRVPEWVREALGKYYLYFADHKGRYIRLAFADSPLGPWQVHEPGSLQIEHSGFPTQPPEVPPKLLEHIQAQAARLELPHGLLEEITTPHIASPDVHVSEAHRAFVMYYHGLEGPALQVTRAATSTDGIHFESRPQILSPSYLRTFALDGQTYGMTMPGQFFRSKDGLTDFEKGPLLFNPDMRHAALLVRDGVLHVFWTQVGHAPERILHSTIDLSEDWLSWTASPPVEILRPEHPWEGADAPLVPSIRSVAYGHVNQLRDPAVYEESGRTYLLYAVAGESGIAIAEILEN